MNQHPPASSPPASSPSDRRGTWREYLLVLSAALVLYVTSAAPTVLWQDSGLAQVRVLQRDLVGGLGLALSHPLYYVLAIAAQALPLAESAFKTNLVSAVFGAVTVANLYLLLRRLTGRRGGAVTGALTLAVAHTFWQHCALAEVYTVSTALLTGELLCLRAFFATGRGRWLVLLAALNGLGISNHMLAVLSLACYGLLALWLLARRRVGAGTLAAAGSAWLLGAGLYLALIASRLAAGDGLAETIRSALFGTGFAHNVLNVAPGLRQLRNSVLYLGLNFPTPTALLLIPGTLALLRLDQRPLRWCLLGLLALHLLWAVRYDVPDQYTFFIPSIVLLAVVIGLGADRFLAARGGGWRIVVAGCALLPAAVYVALPSVARRAHLNLGLTRQVPYRDPYSYFLQPWKTGYRGAERFAREAAELLPDGALLVADGTTVRPIQYFQLTGRWPGGVAVYPPLPRSGRRRPPLRPQDVAGPLAAGRLFVVTPQPGYCPDWLLEQCSFSPHGLLYRALPRGESAPPGAGRGSRGRPQGGTGDADEGGASQRAAGP